MKPFETINGINDALGALMYYAKEAAAIRSENDLTCEGLDKVLGLECGSSFMLEKIANELPSFQTLREVVLFVDFRQELCTANNA